jgi:L-alanine-DL-glutamate epimerase-like enolase superfamily enzyme
MIEARSVNIVMVDILRAGGVNQWMKSAGMAVEYIPWMLCLYKETPEMKAWQARQDAAPRPNVGIHLVYGPDSWRKAEIFSEKSERGPDLLYPSLIPQTLMRP